MKIEQVLEKGLHWVAVSLFVLLVGILTSEQYITIPPLGGFLLRLEFVEWEKEFWMIPEISNRFWYVLVPSVVYAVRCVCGIFFELDAESKDELFAYAQITFFTILFVSLVLCPIFYWLITFTSASKTQAGSIVGMFSFGGIITAVSVALTLLLFVFFSKPIKTAVRTVVAGTTLVGVHAVLLGVSMYPGYIADVCIDSALYTLGTFVVLATLFAPALFTWTLIRRFFVYRFWRYL